jgi:hypothetical protein
VRYVDDFTLFARDKHTLWTYKRAIVVQLANLRLTLHPGAQASRVAEGIPWLGFVVYPPTRPVNRAA